ncbi:MAG: hypothetical protein FJ387_23240 [Verrucomicrobia bacterium]|nr:hypothetical protein [Verrucomicrobiota bacterium]
MASAWFIAPNVAREVCPEVRRASRRSGAGRLVSLVLAGTVGWMAAALAAESPYRSGPGRYPRFESKSAAPGSAVGRVTDLPLPRTILYRLSPDELLADAEAWVERGFGAFFLTGVAGDWSSDVWSADGDPSSIGSSDQTLQKVRRSVARCQALEAEVFLTLSFQRPFEWFNDLAWPVIEHRFRQFAIFAREAGCTGLALDIEYIWPQYHFVWPSYSYEGYTRADLVAAIRPRMTGVARVLFYSHNLRPFMLGRDDQGCAGVGQREAYLRVLTERAVVTDPVYVSVARALRRFEPRDYAEALGLRMVPSFAGPREEVEVGLMPRAVFESSAVAHLAPELRRLGGRTQQGESIDLQRELGTRTRWWLLGPFDPKP